MRGVGVVPPVLAGQGLGEAGLLDRVAVQALKDEGNALALAAEAQYHQLLGANPGIGGGQPQLGFVVVAEASLPVAADWPHQPLPPMPVPPRQAPNR